MPWLKSSPEVRKKRSLVIGCGVGIVVDALVNRCKFDQVIVVDNNADVLKFASKYFNLSEHASLINRDGLEFMIAQDANTFELIVHDIFSGLFMHNNNYIQDLISNCFRILSNNGILVLNLVANVEMEILHEEEEYPFFTFRCRVLSKDSFISPMFSLQPLLVVALDRRPA